MWISNSGLGPDHSIDRLLPSGQSQVAVSATFRKTGTRATRRLRLWKIDALEVKLARVRPHGRKPAGREQSLDVQVF